MESKHPPFIQIVAASAAPNSHKIYALDREGKVWIFSDYQQVWVPLG